MPVRRPWPSQRVAFRATSLRRFLLRGLLVIAMSCLAVVPASAAKRIVIAGGDLTEIAFALGAGQRVVGVDTTSTYPATVGELPSIGYVRTLSPEGVLSLRPEQVLASHFAGPEATLSRLRAAGVSVLQAPAPRGGAADSVPAKIRFVGEALGQEAAAERLVSTFEAELAEVREHTAAYTDGPRVLFVLSAESGPMIIGGKGSVAEAMIRMAGGEPLTGGVTGYRPLSLEAVMALQPDIVLMMAEQLENRSKESVLQRPDLRETPAGRQGRLVAMEGMLLLGYGPRTPFAIGKLHEALRASMATAENEGP
ncbi:heme/hemin ABC transporter substrate-binding protein [Billgrantia endophytica]|uniref:Hemin ABC transporter substrate-binding protein n=1 Tax=Billgrantia endophytica TaxID=2033802 RepID=A0A2N7UA83_9GAMM|nr:ABC transporter substrate-binding protein [Halomonas endophytica]PMR77366.1 hemin ABC transporter substrate-binding protein [Halomonas endophytica]